MKRKNIKFNSISPLNGRIRLAERLRAPSSQHSSNKFGSAFDPGAIMLACLENLYWYDRKIQLLQRKGFAVLDDEAVEWGSGRLTCEGVG